MAAKLSGRILEVRVREGDTVNAGDVIAVLDDAQIRAREDQAQAAVTDAEAKAEVARSQIAVLQEQLRQSELLTEQARTDAQGRVRQAESEVVAAEAELARQEAAYRIAAFDRDAYTRLAATGAVAERKGVEAASTAEQQTAAVAAARRRVESARGALLVAKASLTNPGIRASQAGANRKQIAQQQKEVASANAKIEQARAQLSEAQANRQDLNITAPFSGTVTTRTAEPGEVVSAGNNHRHGCRFEQSLPARLCARRRDRQSKTGPAGARLSRFESESTTRSLRFAHRSRSDFYSGEHVLSRRASKAGRRREAAIEVRHRVRQTRHAC